MFRYLLLLPLISCASQPEGEATDQNAVLCESATRVAALPAGLREASGLAFSRRHPGILWLHNDSGEPVLFAIDTLGKLRARIRVAGVKNEDWEDIAVAPCGDDSCLYIGATGDNLQERTDRAVYRAREPALSDSVTEVPREFRYRLPSGPQDAEALFVTPDERMYIITKGRSGAVTLYAFPRHGDGGGFAILDSVQTLTTGLVQLPDMVTAAGVTPDGRHVMIRTYSALQIYSFKDDQLKPLLQSSGFDLQPLREVQGEAADISAAGVIYLASEKGLENQAPPLSRVTCRL